MNHRPKLAEEWGGHRRGKPAALQRAGVPLLKPRCSLNNKKALGQACLQNRLKPKWFYNVLTQNDFLMQACLRTAL